jgi:hypothetical protein
MPLYQAFAVLVLIPVVASSGFSQEGKSKPNKNGQLEITPEVVERLKRRDERLRDPSFIKLKLEPESNCQAEDSKQVSDCFKTHGKIKIKVFMTNVSSASINITISRTHYPYSPQLFRDGQPVPYRKAMTEVLEKPQPFSSSFTDLLEPGKAKMVDLISLNEWYEPLEPGHYQLDVKWLFLPDGNWTDAGSITFEVEPE